MKRHFHPLVRRQIRRLFTVGLSVTGRKRALDAVSGCEECAKYYRLHQSYESALCGTTLLPTPFMLDRVEAAVLAGIDGAARAEREVPSFWPQGSWLAISAAAAAAMVLCFLWLWPFTHGSDRLPLSGDFSLMPIEGQVASKGATPLLTSQVGLRVFKVTRASAGGLVEEHAPLGLDDVVSFTYSNVSGQMGYLMLFGLQDDGRIRWYFPGYQGQQSISIRREMVDEPLEDGFRLAVNHRQGWLRITAIFSPRPIEKGVLEEAISEQRKVPGALQRLVPLSISADVVEHSVLLHIGESAVNMEESVP